MPFFTRGEISIYYEEYGSGFPVLLFAPGSLSSTIAAWREIAAFDPTVELADEFRLIAMDQRNSGQSWAPITADTGWHSYTEDHLALLDHLGIERAHIFGQCIGGPFSMSLLRAQPERIIAAVLMQPSGRVGPMVRTMGFDRWRESLTNHPEATDAALNQIRTNMYTADFVNSVPREFVPTCQTPLLVLAGNDDSHPFAVAEELARLAPNAEFIAEWKAGPALEAAKQRIRAFLETHTPTNGAPG